MPSAVAARPPPNSLPNSPPNPTFALLAEYRGLPVTRPAEHAPCRADRECRCIGSHAASQSRRSACETPSDRALRGERRRSDGKATPLRSSRADLAVLKGCYALGTGRPCGFRAVQVAPTPRIRPREVPRYGGSEAHGASKSRSPNLKLALVSWGAYKLHIPMPCIRDARIPQEVAGLRLERACVTMVIVRSERKYSARMASACSL